MKFLIIDDDAAERSRTIQALCGKFADVDMIEIGSPDVFNSIIAQADFDLVITEFRLGWTDGLSLFKELHKRYACIPVIMLTASGNETVAVTAIKNGMSGSRYFCESLFWVSQPKQAAKITRPLMPAAPQPS